MIEKLWALLFAAIWIHRMAGTEKGLEAVRTEKRLRSRDVPERCRLRLCRSDGAGFCPDCGRLIFPIGRAFEMKKAIDI